MLSVELHPELVLYCCFLAEAFRLSHSGRHEDRDLEPGQRVDTARVPDRPLRRDLRVRLQARLCRFGLHRSNDPPLVRQE